MTEVKCMFKPISKVNPAVSCREEQPLHPRVARGTLDQPTANVSDQLVSHVPG